MDLNEDIKKYLSMQKQWYKDRSKTPDDMFAKIAGNIKPRDAFNYGLYLFGHLHGPKILEYGCGPGFIIDKGKREYELIIDGVDICENVLEYARKKHPESKFFLNNGFDLASIPDNSYHSVFSVHCLQHIAVWKIRFNILRELSRVLKTGGLLIFQMGWGQSTSPKTYYRENKYNATKTNGYLDTEILDVNEVLTDLRKLGYDEISYFFVPKIVGDGAHQKWVFFYARKEGIQSRIIIPDLESTITGDTYIKAAKV